MSRLEAAFLDASLALRDRETAEKEQQEQQRLQAAEALAREQQEKREAAEALAQEQKQRAEEQAAAAAGMRRRARVAVVIGILALVAAIVAIGAAIYAWRQTQQARENAKLAEDRIAQVGQLVGDLGMERLLSMASQLDQAGDSDGAVTLLQTAVDLNLTLLVDLDASKLTTGTLRLLAEVSLIDKNGAKYAFVPAGAFTMGSDPAIDSLADSDEAPPHSVNLPGYWIGRVEVTNNQYAKFVEATGHAAPDGWQNGNIPAGRDDHPAVNVSWDDAVAYMQWLREESGMAFRLCTEAEWEKACRGTDGRIYPWGDTWDGSKANVDLNGPTLAGNYSPEGDSPYGVSDMAGNVWEWTSSVYKDYPYDSSDGREDANSADVLVVRGGSFYLNARRARCANRGTVFDVGNRYDNFGLRVCVSPGL